MRLREIQGLLDLSKVGVEAVTIAWMLANILEPLIHDCAGLR